MQTSSKDNSVTSAGKKKYKVLNPKGDQYGYIEINPNTPACSKVVLAPIALYLAHASNRESLGDGEFNLLAEALKRFNITADEVFDAFWKAHADQYVSQGKIEFRHLWKHIEKERSKEPTPIYLTRRLD